MQNETRELNTLRQDYKPFPPKTTEFREGVADQYKVKSKSQDSKPSGRVQRNARNNTENKAGLYENFIAANRS